MNNRIKYSKFFKEKVRKLRQKGLSYNQIQKLTRISKSTLSLWLRDIELTFDQKNKFYTNKIYNLNFGAESNKNRRQQEIERIKEKAKKEIEKVEDIAYKIAGSMLYWAEGSKRKNTTITNSDPRMVHFIVRWFNDICGWPPKDMKAHLHIHPGDNEEEIKVFWSELTKIPLCNFGKSFIKPKGTGHRKNILKYGIIKISLKGKGNTNMRHRILSWAEKVYTLRTTNNPL